MVDQRPVFLVQSPQDAGTALVQLRGGPPPAPSRVHPAAAVVFIEEPESVHDGRKERVERPLTAQLGGVGGRRGRRQGFRGGRTCLGLLLAELGRQVTAIVSLTRDSRAGAPFPSPTKTAASISPGSSVNDDAPPAMVPPLMSGLDPPARTGAAAMGRSGRSDEDERR